MTLPGHKSRPARRLRRGIIKTKRALRKPLGGKKKRAAPRVTTRRPRVSTRTVRRGARSALAPRKGNPKKALLKTMPIHHLLKRRKK